MRGPVVCGIEDASGASAAVAARELAERFDLPLLYVHVLERPGEDEWAAGLLCEVAAEGPGELAIASGHPADRLVELARKLGASFVVLGNRGPRSSLLGSVSAEVARRAPCPVLVVPPTASHAESEPNGGILRLGRV